MTQLTKVTTEVVEEPLPKPVVFENAASQRYFRTQVLKLMDRMNSFNGTADAVKKLMALLPPVVFVKVHTEWEGDKHLRVTVYLENTDEEVTEIHAVMVSIPDLNLAAFEPVRLISLEPGANINWTFKILLGDYTTRYTIRRNLRVQVLSQFDPPMVIERSLEAEKAKH
jgi:hypothetical protein